MLLITPAQITKVQADFANNTPQWQAFIAPLNANLGKVINPAYEAGNAHWARDYALAFLASGDTRYAQKAQAVLDMLCTATLRGVWGTRIQIGTGDGTTKTFNLPHSSVAIPSATAYIGADSQHAVAVPKAVFTSSSVTLPTAPAAGVLVFADYQFGAAYQQTSDGFGGTNVINSILVDSGFPARFLGEGLYQAASWLAGYPGVSLSLLQWLTPTWWSALKTKGFSVNDPMNNYGAGDWSFFVNAAAWLTEIGDPNGPALLQQMLAFYTGTVQPALTANGGWPPEGYSYGARVLEIFLHTGMVLKVAGLSDGSVEAAWAPKVYDALHLQLVTPKVVSDLGDCPNGYPLKAPEAKLSTWLAAYGQGPFPTDTTAEDLLFRDPNAPPVQPPTLPTYNDAEGMMTHPTSNDGIYWQLNGFSGPIEGHGCANAGALVVKRVQGGVIDDVLPWTPSISNQLGTFQNKGLLSNMLVVSFPGQTYPWNPGIWGSARVQHSISQDAAGNITATADYTSSWQSPKGVNGVSKTARSLVYSSPGKFVITDQFVQKDPAALCRLQVAHCPVNPTIRADGSWFFVYGNSRVDGQTTADVPVTLSVTPVTMQNSKVTLYRVDITPVGLVPEATFTTTLKVGAAVGPPAPTASFVVGGPDYSITVLFDGSGSSAPSGYVVTQWNWNFGDGHATSSPFPQTAHSYTALGAYNVTLTVTDSNGDTSAPVVQPLTV